MIDTVRPGATRVYRQAFQSAGWRRFTVRVQETDLFIQAASQLTGQARELVLQQRRYVEQYIAEYPAFLHTLEPWPVQGPMPAVVRQMIDAGQAAGVGPMAAVAGALAEAVGRGLLAFSPQVIVENGGDIFLHTRQPVVVGIYAGRSPLNLKIGVRAGGDGACAVCTSSGSIGHSLSLGKADAVCVLADNAALADAAATRIGNQVRRAGDEQAAAGLARQIHGVRGVVIICGKTLAAWGDVELVRLSEKS